MSVQSSSYTPEEIARRGDEIYEQQVRAQVEATNRGKIVAIDIESHAFAINETALSASKELLALKPNAQIWFVRVGHRTLHRIGRATRIQISDNRNR